MSGARPPLVDRTNDPPQEAYLQLWEVLKASNVEAVGDCESEPFAILIRDPDSREVIGGLWARSLWGSFYIDMLVAPAGQRRGGLGGDMMRQAEDEARARGCRNMWLDTFAFQARPFYEMLGFEVFGQLEGPKPAFPRYFMRKIL